MVALALLVGLVAAQAPAARPDWKAELEAPGGARLGSATLSSDGAELDLEVDVADATPAAGPDPVHSDHVEVWLALADEGLVVARPFATTRSGGLFLVGGKADPAALAAEMKPPPAADGGEEDFCREYDARARATIGEPPTSTTRAVFGLVHLGLFPDGRPPVLYDPELYAPTGLAPLPLEQHPDDLRYAATPRQGGYHVSAHLRPGGLIFVPRGGLGRLRVRVDVIDAAPGARERLASSSRAPHWGDPATLARVALAKPIPVALAEGLPELGAPGKVAPGLAKALEALPPAYVRTARGWTGVTLTRDMPSNYDHRSCPINLDTIERTSLQDEDFTKPETLAPGLTSIGVGGRRLLVGRTPGGASAAVVSGEVRGFAYPDGVPGAVVLSSGPMMGRYTSGSCGGADEYLLTRLRLAPRGAQEAQLLEWSTCGPSVTLPGEHSVDLGPDDTVEVKPGPVEGGARLRVDFGATRVDLSWARDGSGLKSKVSTRPEAP